MRLANLCQKGLRCEGKWVHEGHHAGRRRTRLCAIKSTHAHTAVPSATGGMMSHALLPASRKSHAIFRNVPELMTVAASQPRASSNAPRQRHEPNRNQRGQDYPFQRHWPANVLALAQSRKSFSPSIQASISDGTSSGPLRTTELRRKARHLHLESFHFAHDGVFLELQPEPHLNECEASERER